MKDRRVRRKKNQGRSIGGSPDLVVNSSGSGAWVVVEQDHEAAPGGTDDPDAPGQLTQEEVDREDRLFMCQAMMKCADISNPVGCCGEMTNSLTVTDWRLCSADLIIFHAIGRRCFWKSGLPRRFWSVISVFRYPSWRMLMRRFNVWAKSALLNYLHSRCSMLLLKLYRVCVVAGQPIGSPTNNKIYL